MRTQCMVHCGLSYTVTLFKICQNSYLASSIFNLIVLAFVFHCWILPFYSFLFDLFSNFINSLISRNDATAVRHKIFNFSITYYICKYIKILEFSHIVHVSVQPIHSFLSTDAISSADLVSHRNQHLFILIISTSELSCHMEFFDSEIEKCFTYRSCQCLYENTKINYSNFLSVMTFQSLSH